MSDAIVKGLAGAYTVGWEQEQIAIRIDRIREDSPLTIASLIRYLPPPGMGKPLQSRCASR